MSTPPGWYPDPGAPGGVRWWDGNAWTGHVQQAPPAAPAATTDPATPGGAPLAGWWWRALAVVLDGLILVVPALLVSLPAQTAAQRELDALQRGLERDVDAGRPIDVGGLFGDVMAVYADHAVGLYVLPALLGLLYHGAFLRWRGATPGKMVCGLQVRLRERPGRLPWASVGLRLLAQTVPPALAVVVAFFSGSLLAVLTSLAVLAYVLVDYLSALGQRRQTLHDRVARTVVVRTRR